MLEHLKATLEEDLSLLKLFFSGIEFCAPSTLAL
jgi:hypothetical protein